MNDSISSFSISRFHISHGLGFRWNFAHWLTSARNSSNLWLRLRGKKRKRNINVHQFLTVPSDSISSEFFFLFGKIQVWTSLKLKAEPVCAEFLAETNQSANFQRSLRPWPEKKVCSVESHELGIAEMEIEYYNWIPCSQDTCANFHLININTSCWCFFLYINWCGIKYNINARYHPKFERIN